MTKDNDMTRDKDIVAHADPDAPEILDADMLDDVTGGAQYGSSNSCEPVTPTPTESFSLNYEEITWTWSARNADRFKSR